MAIISSNENLVESPLAGCTLETLCSQRSRRHLKHFMVLTTELIRGKLRPLQRSHIAQLSWNSTCHDIEFKMGIFSVGVPWTEALRDPNYEKWTSPT